MSYRGNWIEVVKTCSCGHDIRVNVSQMTFNRRQDRYDFETVCGGCHSPFKGSVRMEKKADVEAA